MPILQIMNPGNIGAMSSLVEVSDICVLLLLQRNDALIFFAQV